MNRTIISVSAVALLLAAPALAQSQRPDPGGATDKGGPAPGGGQPPAVKEAPGAGETKDAPPRKDAPEKSGKAARDDGGDAKRSDTPKREGKSAPKSAAESKAPTDSKSGTKNADTPNDRKSAGTKEKSGTADAKSGGGEQTLQVAPEKKTRARTAFTKYRSSARVNLDINVNIGVAIPRTVRLYAVPQDIIVIVPEYRRYRYFIVGDTVCIVDPVTWLIVDIISLV